MIVELLDKVSEENLIRMAELAKNMTRDPEVLDAIDAVLRRYRNFSKPFGGLQLLMIGDLHQLPPVVNSQEWELLGQHYSTPYFFGSKALQETPIVRTYLRVADVERAVQEISQLGGEIALEPTELPGHGRIAIYLYGGIQQGVWQTP